MEFARAMPEINAEAETERGEYTTFVCEFQKRPPLEELRSWQVWGRLFQAGVSQSLGQKRLAHSPLKAVAAYIDEEGAFMTATFRSPQATCNAKSAVKGVINRIGLDEFDRELPLKSKVLLDVQEKLRACDELDKERIESMREICEFEAGAAAALRAYEKASRPKASPPPVDSPRRTPKTAADLIAQLESSSSESEASARAEEEEELVGTDLVTLRMAEASGIGDGRDALPKQRQLVLPSFPDSADAANRVLALAGGSAEAHAAKVEETSAANAAVKCRRADEHEFASFESNKHLSCSLCGPRASSDGKVRIYNCRCCSLTFCAPCLEAFQAEEVHVEQEHATAICARDGFYAARGRIQEIVESAKRSACIRIAGVGEAVLTYVRCYREERREWLIAKRLRRARREECPSCRRTDRLQSDGSGGLRCEACSLAAVAAVQDRGSDLVEAAKCAMSLAKVGALPPLVVGTRQKGYNKPQFVDRLANALRKANPTAETDPKQLPKHKQVEYAMALDDAARVCCHCGQVATDPVCLAAVKLSTGFGMQADAALNQDIFDGKVACSTCIRDVSVRYCAKCSKDDALEEDDRGASRCTRCDCPAARTEPMSERRKRSAEEILVVAKRPRCDAVGGCLPTWGQYEDALKRDEGDD